LKTWWLLPVLVLAGGSAAGRRKVVGRLTDTVPPRHVASVTSDPSFGRSGRDVRNNVSNTDDDGDDNGVVLEHLLADSRARGGGAEDRRDREGFGWDDDVWDGRWGGSGVE